MSCANVLQMHNISAAPTRSVRRIRTLAFAIKVTKATCLPVVPTLMSATPMSVVPTATVPTPLVLTLVSATPAIAIPPRLAVVAWMSMNVSIDLLVAQIHCAIIPSDLFSADVNLDIKAAHLRYFARTSMNA